MEKKHIFVLIKFLLMQDPLLLLNPQSGDQLVISSLSLYQWAIISVLLLNFHVFSPFLNTSRASLAVQQLRLSLPLQ